MYPYTFIRAKSSQPSLDFLIFFYFIILQGSMFGVSGRFPPAYIGCVMTGQALGGVIPASAAVALIAFDVKPQLLGETKIVQ